MRKRYRYIFLFLLVGILCLLASLVYQPREPIYRGHPINYWIVSAGEGFFDVNYFPKVDSNAIPYLVNALGRRTGPLPGIYAKIWTNSPAFIQGHLRVPRPIIDWQIRANAAQVLGRVGANSPPAISGLLRVLKKDDNAIVRVCAVESLQNIGKGNDTVLHAIIAALKDKAPEMRDAAGDALWQLDPATAKTLLK